MGFYNPPTGGGGGVTSWSGGPTGLTPASPTTGAVVLGGTLGTGYGGTNNTATPTAGAVAFGDGSKYDFTAVGTAGQYLQSTGAGTPTWTTISNSGIGSPGYYGLLISSSNQANGGSTTANVVTLDSALLANGISIVSSSRITFANAGQYELTSELFFTNSSGSNVVVSVWLAQNGTNIANSSQAIQYQGGAGAIQQSICSWLVNASAGDYVQIYWSCSATTVSMITSGAATSPTRPVSPSAIVNVFSLPQIGIGYYNLTSTTSTLIGTGSKTFTVSTSSTSSAFTVGTRVRVAYTTTPSNWMEGVITAYSGTSLTVNVDTVGGSGTYAAWTFSVAGVNNSSLVVGTTAITGGTTTRVLYDNAGVVGEYSSVPIANGGTGQATAGAAFNALSPITSTGDLILGNGTNSATRLGIGTSGYVLTSNGTTASWAVTAITLGTTTVSGTSGYVLYNNSGVAGSFALGTGVQTALGVNTGSTGAVALVPANYFTVQRLTSGSGTYTTPSGVKYLHIRMVGAGGGGAGTNGTNANSAGTTGGDTSFGSWTAKGGQGGPTTGVGASGGTGGTDSTGTLVIRMAGNASSAYNGSGFGSSAGGAGPWGGAGYGGYTSAGQNAAANSGAGGGGASGTPTAALNPPGGGAGEYVEFLVASPASTYSYSIPAGGAGGGGGISGGTGGSGVVIVEEYYS